MCCFSSSGSGEDRTLARQVRQTRRTWVRARRYAVCWRRDVGGANVEGNHAAARRRVLGARRQGTVSVPPESCWYSTSAAFALSVTGLFTFARPQVYLGYDLEILHLMTGTDSLFRRNVNTRICLSFVQPLLRLYSRVAWTHTLCCRMSCHSLCIIHLEELLLLIEVRRRLVSHLYHHSCISELR